MPAASQLSSSISQATARVQAPPQPSSSTGKAVKYQRPLAEEFVGYPELLDDDLLRAEQNHMAGLALLGSPPASDAQGIDTHARDLAVDEKLRAVAAEIRPAGQVLLADGALRPPPRDQDREISGLKRPGHGGQLIGPDRAVCGQAAQI